MVKTQSLYLNWSWDSTRSCQTDRRTELPQL